MSRGLDAAVGRLFEQHGALVYRRALRLLGNPADAEEATQEVFVRVMRSPAAFEGRSAVTTWLYQITTHYCLNLIRDRARRRDLFAQHVLPADDTTSARGEDFVLLRRLLASADERQARAAIHVYVDGMSHEEAAAELGVSASTVRNLLDRFRQWARAQDTGPREGDEAAAGARPEPQGTPQ
jgi:RNA polymerase sigma-70 factor (ECF subfamily)